MIFVFVVFLKFAHICIHIDMCTYRNICIYTYIYVYIQVYMYYAHIICMKSRIILFFGIKVESQSLRTHFPIYQPLLISFRLIYHSVKCCCFCQLKWAVRTFGHWDKCLICHMVLLLLKAQDLWSVCFSSFALHVGFRGFLH